MSYPVRKNWVTLLLTSPHMRNSRVTEAQELLTHNRFKDFQPGVIDGDYGEHAAGATHRAKYWTGYYKGDLNGQFGNTLRCLLLPESHPQFTPLPAINKLRRQKRLAAYALTQKKRNTVAAEQVRAHAYAKSQVGYKESPFGSNDTKFGSWYGINGAPWCAIFRTYCWVVGGGYSKGVSWIRGRQFSYVPYIVAAARLRQHGLELVSSQYVIQGDTVCYDWNHDGTADHTESFDEWVSKGYSFWAIGGNTGPVNASNGGEVARELRYVSEVQAFVRVFA